MNKTAKIIIGVLSFILLVVLFLMWDQHRVNQINAEKMKVTPVTETPTVPTPEATAASEVVVLAEDKEPIETAQVSNVNGDDLSPPNPPYTENPKPKNQEMNYVDLGKSAIEVDGPNMLQELLDHNYPDTFMVTQVSSPSYVEQDSKTVYYVWNIRFKDKKDGRIYGCDVNYIQFDKKTLNPKFGLTNECFREI